LVVSVGQLRGPAITPWRGSPHSRRRLPRSSWNFDVVPLTILARLSRNRQPTELNKSP